MLRFNQEQDSARTVSTKSFITNSSNLFYPQQNEKSTFSLHQSEVFAEKHLKKGIKTTVSNSLQNTLESSEKIIYINRQSEFDYTKSLEIQISSREKERLQIYKNLEDLKRQNAKITHELNEERKKSAAFRMKSQQMEIFLKQNLDQKKALTNEKDQLFNQYQFEIQRRKSVEQNDQKLRFKFEALQLESNTKINQNILALNKANQENKKLKQQIQKLNNQLKVLEFSNQSFKKQLSDLFVQKQKTIDSILMDKQFIQNELKNYQFEHQKLTNIHMQKQEELRSMDKYLINLSQQKQSQKNNLSNEMSQIKLQSQNLKKNYEVAKDNFKRQLQVLVNEGSRMREIIIQFQNGKNIDKACITMMQRKIQELEKQKSQETHQKLTLSQQLQKQRKSFQQEKSNLSQIISFIESGLQQKSRQVQVLNKKQIDSQREAEITKYRYSTQKDLLLREINFLKQQISAKTSQFSETSTKLIQQRQKLQKQLYQKNQLAESLSQELQDLNEKIKTSEGEISSLKSEHVSNQQRYEKGIVELKSQFTDELNLQKKSFQLQRQEIIKSAQKARGNFQSQINQMKFQIGNLKQQKNQLTIILHNLEKSSSISIMQLKNHIQSLESHVNNLQSEIQRLISKHSEQFQLFKNKKANEIASIQEEHEAQVNLLNEEFSQKNQQLQNQIFSYQEKLKQFQKIIEKKNLQYQQLQKHFNQIIERQNQQHTNQIQKYLQQLQSMGQRLINASNHDFLIKKIQILQETLLKKQAELKVVEENNTLLRKNFINSLTQQQNLRGEIKINRSHYSENKSQSGEKSRRDMSQQLRNKYLSQHLIQNDSEGNNNEMNLSLKQRCNSNSQLNSIRYRDHQRSYKYVPVMSQRNMENSEVEFQTQRRVSNIQKPPLLDPLNLRKIRQRNQLHQNTQVYNNTKIFTQEAQAENCNSDSRLTTSQVIPIKLQQSTETFTMKQDEQLLESEEQF